MTTTTPEERAANTAKCRRARKRRAARGLAPDDPRHGKASTYTNWGCRCERCTAANTEKRRLSRVTAGTLTADTGEVTS